MSFAFISPHLIPRLIRLAGGEEKEKNEKKTHHASKLVYECMLAGYVQVLVKVNMDS